MSKKLKCQAKLFIYIIFFFSLISLSLSLSLGCQSTSSHHTNQHQFIDYISFEVPNESFPNITNCICMVRGFMHDLDSLKKGYSSLEAILLCVLIDY